MAARAFSRSPVTCRRYTFTAGMAALMGASNGSPRSARSRSARDVPFATTRSRLPSTYWAPDSGTVANLASGCGSNSACGSGLLPKTGGAAGGGASSPHPTRSPNAITAMSAGTRNRRTSRASRASRASQDSERTGTSTESMTVRRRRSWPPWSRIMAHPRIALQAGRPLAPESRPCSNAPPHCRDRGGFTWLRVRCLRCCSSLRSRGAPTMPRAPGPRAPGRSVLR